MSKNKERISLEEAKNRINLIFSQAIKKLEELHLKKIDLITKYETTERAEEIDKIRQDLKNLNIKQ